jgi:tetratricopeptide (TPR) repeat protein
MSSKQKPDERLQDPSIDNRDKGPCGISWSGFHSRQNKGGNMRFFIHTILVVLLFVPSSLSAAGPNSAEVYFKRGLARYAAGDLEGSIADFSRAIELNSGFKNSSLRRQLDLGFNAIDAGPLAQQSNTVAILDRFNIDAYYNRGRARLDKRDTDGALADLNTAIRLDPYNAPAYVSRGRAFKAKKQLEAAIRDFRKAIELDPSFAIAYYNCGTIQYERKEFHESITAFTRAAEIDPRMAMAFNDRGNAQASLGNFQAAIGDYGRAIALNQQLAIAFANRGLVLLLQGKKTEADKDFMQCLKLAPEMADQLKELSVIAEKARKR